MPIGSWVLRQACRQARAWLDAFPSPEGFGVSVNVSPRQLREPGYVDDVAAALLEAGLEPRQLTLEITESVMVDDTEVMTERMSELKDLGVRLSIADFGTGYSSLSYLTRLPVHVLTTADDVAVAQRPPVIDKARHLDHLVDLLGTMTGVP